MAELTWIAATEVVFVHPDGTRAPGTIQISLPDHGPKGDARCFYKIEPIAKGCAIYGADNLQALALALRMCAVELALFEKRGGVIEHPADANGEVGERWEGASTFGDFFRVPS